ncbi:hypothetical protein [Alicyclobacillus macrosporangiidus]|uniref:hypothetical protein n=1 Tax=Alicyclobacillus macrosporangiidus TaxID=392015 RepID=UPI000AA2BB32|nr:hypothetical protein [Alicyclobacillus macrosporangiidus]
MRVRDTEGARIHELSDALYTPRQEAEQLLGDEEDWDWPEDWEPAPREWNLRIQRMRRH